MRRRGGFTLIELLVVIGIIAVLIAILLPTMGRARERARIVACGTNLHGYGVAMQTYMSEFGKPPTTLTNPFGGATPAAFWVYNNHNGEVSLEGLAPYMRGVSGLNPNRTDVSNITITKVWFCPSQGVGQPSTSPDTAQWKWFLMNYSYFGGFDTSPLKGMATKPDLLFGRKLQTDRVMMEDNLFRWVGGGNYWSFNHGDRGAVAQHLNGPKFTGQPKLAGNNVLYSDFSVSFKKAAEYGTPAQFDANPSVVSHVNGGGGDQTFY